MRVTFICLFFRLSSGLRGAASLPGNLLSRIALRRDAQDAARHIPGIYRERAERRFIIAGRYGPPPKRKRLAWLLLSLQGGVELLSQNRTVAVILSLQHQAAQSRGSLGVCLQPLLSQLDRRVVVHAEALG